METAILLVQIVATSGLAGWLVLGVRDNILHPAMNETYTAEVLEMRRLRTEYPEAYAQVVHRAVTDRRLQVLAFRAVVIAELVAAVLLCAGTVALVLAMIGVTSSESARALAVGNYFYYWFCHEGAQNTHYQMTLWGIGTAILVSQG